MLAARSLARLRLPLLASLPSIIIVPGVLLLLLSPHASKQRILQVLTSPWLVVARSYRSNKNTVTRCTSDRPSYRIVLVCYGTLVEDSTMLVPWYGRYGRLHHHTYLCNRVPTRVPAGTVVGTSISVASSNNNSLTQQKP